MAGRKGGRSWHSRGQPLGTGRAPAVARSDSFEAIPEMSPRPFRLEQALDLVPDSDDLLPLRDALIGASRDDAQRAWTASEAYATLDTRLADLDALESLVPELVESAARRLEEVYRSVIDSLRLARAGEGAAAAHSLVRAGELEEAANRLPAAELFYRKALEIGRRPRDRRVEGLALCRLGRVARARGQFRRSLELYRQGYEVAEAQGDHAGMVLACQGLGNVHGDLGGWQDAGQWYQRGIALASDSPSRPLWQLQSNLSVVARRMGELEASTEWLLAAEETVNALGDVAGRVFLRNAEGRLRQSAGDVPGAEASYRAALMEEITPAARATVLVNLIECLLLQERVAEADRVARELEQIVVVHRLTPLLPHSYRALGSVARARRDREGFLFFEQALELCRVFESSPMEWAATQHEYGRFEAEIGEVESAAARLREAERIMHEIGAAPELEQIRYDLAALQARRVD